MAYQSPQAKAREKQMVLDYYKANPNEPIPAGSAYAQDIASMRQASSPASNKVTAPQAIQPISSFVAPSGPPAPQYSSILNQWGDLDARYRLSSPVLAEGAPDKISAGTLNVTANQDALNALKGRAMAQGDSPWLKMALEKEALERTDAMDRAGAGSLGELATARNQLAMKGGLSSGANERLAMNAGRNLTAARQGIGRQGKLDRLNLGVADDQMKMDLLSRIPGMDLQFAGFKADQDKFNILNKLDVDKYNTDQLMKTKTINLGNTLSGIGGLNQFDMSKYQEQMKGYAADRTADAIAASGGGGGVFGSSGGGGLGGAMFGPGGVLGGLTGASGFGWGGPGAVVAGASGMKLPGGNKTPWSGMSLV